MTMTGKFFISFLVTLVVVVSTVPIINIKTDYHRVLQRDFHALYKVRRENTSFLKVAYLIDHPDQFDNIIFGSSRVGYGINTVTLAENLGGSWFKLSYPGGVPYQHFYNLKALLANGFIPKKVVIAMNDFDAWAAKGDQKYHKNYNRRLYPNGLFDYIKFYSFYLFKKPSKAEFDILAGKIKLQTNHRIVGEIHGFSSSKNSNEKKRKASLIARKPYHWKRADLEYNYDESLDYLGRIVSLCRKNGVELYLVNLPTQLKSLAARNFNDLDSYKREVVKYHGFYDFSGSYSIANTPLYWFENSHFGRELGSKMIEVFANEKRPPGQFGSYVTADNITQHLSLVKEGVLADLPVLLMENNNAVISESLLSRPQNLPLNLFGSPLFAENDGGKTTLQIPKKRLEKNHYVVRLSLNALAQTSFGVMANGKRLAGKKLVIGDNRVYFYSSVMDLANGLDFVIDSNKIDFSASRLELFSLKYMR